VRPYLFRGFGANRRIFSLKCQYAYAGQQARDGVNIPDHLLRPPRIASQTGGQAAGACQAIMVHARRPGAACRTLRLKARL
jgi:hypothetical protein